MTGRVIISQLNIHESSPPPVNVRAVRILLECILVLLFIRRMLIMRDDEIVWNPLIIKPLYLRVGRRSNSRILRNRELLIKGIDCIANKNYKKDT